MLIVYIVCKDRDEAKKIARHLVEKRLIACGNMFPIESCYHWQGRFVEDAEYVLLGKTLEEHWEAIKEEVRRLHSYEVPAILKFGEVEANEPYLRWVEEETRSL
jgi:periplasmic divalent cation tolerance protein